ncbi:MAG: OB-fold nucleic acid binding domain-containing protein, partial [Terriglobia bacterium]
MRFGFGAIKNVGENSVQAILEARKAGSFKDLNDFTRRVDLRTVGKRSLECLIKVGALDSLGPRGSLLESLERIVSASTSHFRAADAGQLSLFGADTGVSEDIQLTNHSKIEQREMLNWERELIGLYISDHPLTPYQPTFAKLVTYFSGQLAEAQHEEKVRVAGLITQIRPYVTKAGKPMGFVTLEDIQGNIELVLFPRTWAQCQPILENGKIVVVEGKVDAQSSPPKILVDAIKTDFKMLVPVNESTAETLPPHSNLPIPPLPQGDREASRSEAEGGRVRGGEPEGGRGSPPARPQPASPPKQTPAGQPPAKEQPVRQVAVKETPVKQAPTSENLATAPASIMDAEGGPPPPDNFPDGWDNEWQPSFENAEIAARPEPISKKDEPLAKPASPLSEGSNLQITEPAPPVRKEALPSVVEEVPKKSEPAALPSLYVPLAQAEDRNHRPQQITVMLRPTGDQERDKRRIKTIYGTLI